MRVPAGIAWNSQARRGDFAPQRTHLLASSVGNNGFNERAFDEFLWLTGKTEGSRWNREKASLVVPAM